MTRHLHDRNNQRAEPQPSGVVGEVMKRKKITLTVFFLFLFSLVAYALSDGTVRFTQESREDPAFELDSTPLPDNSSGRIHSYADVLDKAKPAVVTIASESIVRIMKSPAVNPMEQLLRRLYGLPNRSSSLEPTVEERKMRNGIGSGVIISPEGYILTNNHVVTDENGNSADSIIVTLSDGTEVSADLIGRDPQTDVAVVKIDRPDLPFLKMADSDLIRVGDVVFAIGNPLGLDQTVTMGIVSATGRSQLGILGSQGYEDFIQTDAAINMGNSGGALIDTEGRLIGINTAIFSQSGGSIGIGFAIPTRLARTVLLGLLEHGSVQRGFLGVSIRDLDADLSDSFGLDHTDGALIEDIQEGSPADVSGLRRGDIILTFNGSVIKDAASLRLKVAQLLPGSEIKMDIYRDGKTQGMSIVLGDQKTDAVAEDMSAGELLEGLYVEPFAASGQEALSGGSSGLLIKNVDVSCPYAQVLRPGMLILEINGQEANTLNEGLQYLHQGANHLWISYRGRQIFVAIRL